ncbi:type IV secretory system conjugative DNA transfer family protein [Nocardiopsis exhalans]|uniref:Type IV secretory system conjugative DNA transfer family protein n=1 Tax=Nocardiopsis exhalans TaxID=163604 RepID=A0ABY5D3P5_9ACTN|nr:type IV secretory system conjugative DNA transfer family protein [Nocardiopsis exhalans]USY17873.1 type IV secretory system conjugative DNA transfer family protein [Nocardiopsis exhalans]
MGLKALRAKRPTASTWEKIRARRPDETLSNRDVHGDQQLDRSTLGTRRSRTPGFIGAAITGTAVFALAWLVYSILTTLFIGISGALGGFSTGVPAEQPYYVKTQVSEGGKSVTCYKQTDETGSPSPGGKCYGSAEEVPKPDWYQGEYETRGTDEPATTTIRAQLATVTGFKLFITVGTGLAVALVISTLVTRRVSAENLMHDTDDINQHQNDQHIALPEEIMEKFDYFPDTGAHSAVQVSSVISHTMLKKKGLGTVDLVERAEDDIIDEDGEILYYAGDPLEDTDGNVKTRTVPLIDEDFGKALFEASGVPDVKGSDGKPLRKRFDTTVIPYNPDGKAREKLGKYKTVADLIMDDWTFPDYEVQRPAGAYIVDTAPVNTMVLAITRGGKGQTIIEPTLDMWSREKRPSNMIINDPKGELLVKNYVPFVMRGFEPVQFNLINPVKTNIYNPLGMAADAAREGDSTKCAQYVENIGDVFFPVSGGEDPVWPKAAGNSFKRAAYGLIDVYMEEERELREYAVVTDMPPEVLEQRLDEMWGKVTLYNCYQMFVQLTSKKMKNPEAELEKRVKKGEFDNDEEGLQAEQRRVEAQSPLWEGKPEQDMLTLYFNATAALPTNTVRTLIGNADNALRAMAGAEKMIASVYGIALTAMSFFSDPTISRLTSGRPSQTTDFGSLSFPRRMGVRFSQNYLKRDNLMREMLAKWSAYSDPMFSESLGKDFDHQDVVTPEGWARYYFEGKFPTDEAWVKLELVDAEKQMLVRTFYFHFKKSYQLSLNGRHFVKEQVTGEKIVKDGVIRELRPAREGGKADGTILSFEPSNTEYPQDKLNLADSVVPERIQGRARAIQQTMVRYSEKTKAVFLVTPPHLTKYAQIVLILIKQLVDLNFDKSYMTKSNQKPLYKTRFMLDELGNLSSDGEGIQSFQTMLSIGLGQEQQFTLILQTLQQLRDVYGDSVDKIVQGNAQPFDALIATPDGWQRMGDTKVGDAVLTPFGTSTEVTGVYPKGVRPVYRVTTADGSSAEACGEHLWTVERWKSSFTEVDGRTVGTGPGGKTCERVQETIDTDTLRERIEAGQKISLPRITAVPYRGADLPIDPYVLGAVLGDGHVQENGVVKFTSADEGIVAEIRRRGYTVVEDTVHGERRDGIGYRINGLAEGLRELDLVGKRSWEKSIPEVYLYSSLDQRKDLLRGLMDTDGTIGQTGEMEFVSSSPELAGGVQSVIRSLGGRGAINVKNEVLSTSPNQREKKRARPAYRVQNIRLPEVNPFLLARKADLWKDRTDTSGDRVVSVEYLRDDEVQCIRVADERHLYITDDYLPTHNTSNIIFLKSTDDSMLETLEKMSGKTHRVYRDSKQITQDMNKVIGGKTQGAVSYTMSTQEEPLIKFNDMYFIPERNSIVFRAGDAPVWNRNETILPMSWRLFKNTIRHAGHDEYTLQTIPTLSTAVDFDVKLNQPDFKKLLDKRIAQAMWAGEAKQQYQDAYGYEDIEIARLDPDLYADEVMEIIRGLAAKDEGLGPDAAVMMDPDDYEASIMIDDDLFVENVELAAEVHDLEADESRREERIYAEGLVSREMLVHRNGVAKLKTLDVPLAEAYKHVMLEMQHDDEHFSVGGDGELRSADGSVVYISPMRSATYSEAAQRINGHLDDEDSRAFAEQELTEEDLRSLATVKIHAAFYQYLASLESWEVLADGAFDRAMAVEMRQETHPA